MEKVTGGTGEEQLAASRILAVTEEELKRIILDLHDGPVQQLFAAQSQLRGLQTRLNRDEAIPNEEYQLTFQRVSRLLEASLAEIRQFLGTFRPPDFASQDLVEMLHGLFMHHELATGVVIDFRVTGNQTVLQLPLPSKITLYRICQEALSNAYRHAQATQQQVQLHIAPHSVVLTVQDDGIGFRPPPLRGPQATEREEHIGLRGMRDRVDLIGGTFELDSKPGQGTRIQVKIPIHE
ncbi:MAG: sensor histidine kinase [Candidatus Promineifilaceae bacterium]